MKPWRSLLLCAGPVLAALVLGCEDGPPRLVEGRADMALIPALEIRGDDMTPGKPILTYFASYFGYSVDPARVPRGRWILTYFASYFGYSCKASATLGVGDPGEEDVDGDLVGHFAHAGVELLIPFDRQRRSGLFARLGLAGYGYQRFEYDYSGGHDWLKDEGGRVINLLDVAFGLRMRTGDEATLAVQVHGLGANDVNVADVSVTLDYRLAENVAVGAGFSRMRASYDDYHGGQWNKVDFDVLGVSLGLTGIF